MLTVYSTLYENKNRIMDVNGTRFTFQSQNIFFLFTFTRYVKEIVCKNKLCVVITSQFWDYKWELLNLNLVFMWYSWYTAWDGSKPKYSVSKSENLHEKVKKMHQNENWFHDE